MFEIKYNMTKRQKKIEGNGKYNVIHLENDD